MQVSSNLSAKFQPYILTREDTLSEKRELKAKLDAIFAKSLSEETYPLDPKFGFIKLGDSKGVKNHVVEHPDLNGWIIKGRRSDRPDFISDDAHIYRVRKATKMQDLFVKNDLHTCKVPTKYLYQHKNEWYVIAEKVQLSKHFKISLLTKEQAKGMALTAYDADYYDLKEENMALDDKSRLWFYDTEATGRSYKRKPEHRSWLPRYRFLSSFVATQRFIIENPESEELCKVVADIQEQKFYERRNGLITNFAATSLVCGGSLFAARSPSRLRAFAASGVALISGVASILNARSIKNHFEDYRYVKSDACRAELIQQANEGR